MREASQIPSDMPETAQNNRIVEEIANNPQAKELRNMAGEITNIVFQTRSRNVFLRDIDLQGFEEKEKERIKNLLKDFRIQIADVIGQNIKMTDDDLYSKIIYPLVMTLLNRAI